MTQPKLRFSFSEPDIDTQRPVVDGTVKVEGFDLEIVPKGAPWPEWDVRDHVSVGRVCGSVEGDGLVCIPAWPNRKFRTSYIYVNEAAGIETPRDLEGKRVATQGWMGPAGVWARGALQNYYEIDLTSIHWFTPNPTAAPTAPGIRIDAIPPGVDELDRMLVAGELDAVIDANVLPSIINRDPRVRRLFRDWKAEAQEYYRATHIFPISHLVTLKQEFVDRHPAAPIALLSAYREARDIAIKRVEGSDPEYLIISWASHQLAEQRALMGDHYWPYNIEDNIPTLEALTLFAHQQGLTPHRVDYHSLFHPEAAALPGW
jgi:4,5-dihydroxyphthalate decarboxylase